MKKVILLVFGCLAFVSVHAQKTITPEQVKKNIDTQLKNITAKADFSDTQKAYLQEYVAYTIKSKTNGFKKEAKAMNLKDVNMDTFFTEHQRKVIQETLAHMPVHAPTRTSAANLNNTQSAKTGF